MSFTDEYLELRKKRKKEEEAKAGSTEVKKPLYVNKTAPLYLNAESYYAPRDEEDIAPVAAKKEEKRTWFQKGALEDGVSADSVAKTILGSGADLFENLGTGIMRMGEGVVDALAYLSPSISMSQQAEYNPNFRFDIDEYNEEKERAAKFIKKDLYDEEKIAKKIISDPLKGIGVEVDEDSVFGEKTDSLVQSAGQLGATVGLQAVGVPWFVTTGITSFGGEVEGALNEGAGYEDAGLSAAISAGAEILTEKISGGIKFGGKALDDAVVKRIARGVSNKTLRTLTRLGFDATGEGAEEVLSGVMSAIGKKLTYADDKELTELFSKEEAWESFIGGAVLGGASSGISGIKGKLSGVDYTTELTKNEQKVIDKVYKDRVAEEQKKGKVTQKRKDEIYDAVLREMERGYIDTDTIEEVLGGDSYKTYKDTIDSEDALAKEYEELGKLKEPTLAERTRFNELHEQMKNKDDSKRKELKSKLGEEVFGMVKGDRLVESYNESARRGHDFEADLTKYDEKQKAVIQKAIDSGILNNTNKTHEFVDMIAKISADKGVPFDFTNNQKLKESGFAVEGKTVNGYVTKDGVTLNVESAKSLNSVVGHEITHVLEGTELYDVLQKTIVEYAKSKGDYQGRYDSLSELYKNVKDADVDAELTADLVGDYLFTDADFINNLSTNNRNVFQKIYDEIKYLCKVVTAGSKEARELERVKKAFEDAYRQGGKVADTKYSIGEIVDESGESYGIGVHLDSELLDNLAPDERKAKVKERIKELGGDVFTAYDNNGNAVDITIAKSNARFKNESGKNKPVNKDLTNKHIGNVTKQEAVVLIDELITTSKFQTESPARHKHGWLDNDGQNNWDIWTTYIQDKNNTIWEATLNVANTADGRKIIYDIDPIRKVGQSSKLDTSLLNDKLAQDAEDVKKQFSLSESVEETDRLVAVHNKSVRGIMRMLERDGVPFPSIAIKKDGASHEGFGECSIVFPRSTIDPEESRWNRLYSNDAWTPTEPHTEYDVGDTYKYKKLFENMLGSDVYHALHGSGYLDSDSLERALGSNKGDVFDAVKDLSVVKYGYLQSIGQRPEAGTKQKRLDGFGRYQNDQLLAVFDAIGGETIRNASYSDTELKQRIADILNEQFQKKHPTMGSAFKGLKNKPLYDAGDIRITAIQDAYEAWDAAGQTIPTEIDIDSVDSMLRGNRELEESDGYRRWVEDIFDGLVKDSGIRNGKDIFTPSGNRRSFKALHVPATLENIVQQMRKENETGIGAVGDINLRGAATKSYATVEDMRKDSGKLLGTHITDDVYDGYMDGFHKRLNELNYRAAKQDSWTSRESAEHILLEAVRDAKTKASMKTKLRKEAEWINYDEALVEDLWQLKQDVQNMPAPYFEAKPRRIVYPQEAAAYIVPDNAPPTLFSELSKRGLYFKTYEADNEADRLGKLNELLDEQPDLRFSLSNSDEQYAPMGNFNVYGRDMMKQTTPMAETTPVAETAPSAPVVGNDIEATEQVNAPVEEDIAPVPETPKRMAYEAIRPKPEKQPRLVRATPEEQATASVLTEEPKVEKKKGKVRSWIKNNVLDKGMVFEDLSLKTGNRELQARWNSIRYAEGKAQRFMEKGNASVSSLKSIRDTVEKSGKTKEFYEYLYHNLNVDRMTLEERYDDVPNKTVFGDSVTANVSREAVARLEKANPEFKKWAQDVYKYNESLREQLVENGVISRETADLWAEMYPHYVPIRRAGDAGLDIDVPLDTRRTGINAPIKKATGGSRDIMPLFDTMGQRTIQTYKAIAKNRFGVELKNTLGTTISNDATSVDEIIDSIDAQDELLQKGKNGRNPTFTVFENGEKVTFDITDEMYDAMKPKSEAMAYTNKVLNTANNIRRGLLTEYNPAFMLTNPIKDTQDVVMNSQHPAKTYANYPKAIAELLGKKGHWYQEYMENGGEQNTYFDNETSTFKEPSKLRKVLGFPLDKISDANNFIERVPRMAEYIASRKSGRSIDVSMLDAARVTTNFAAGGDLTKLANRNGFTFLNASVQGAVQQVRTVREAKANGLKGAMTLAAKIAVAGLPSILLNHLLWDDDEEYAELSDYVKQNYYIVGKYGDGKFVRIPKGRALAVIQNAFEQMENAITGNDEVDLATFGELVISNLAPSNPLDNNLIAPIAQALRNETWYGDDLVPTRLSDLPAAEQYDETTDSISKWLGEKTNVSPYKLNYVLDQYSGAVGDMLLPMLTPEAERGDQTLLAPIADKFTTDSVMKNQNVSDFYTTKDELAINANGDSATDEDVLKYKYMNSVNAELSNLYKQKREVQSGDLPDAEKYEAVREIQKEIIELTKEGLASYEDVSVSDGYATVADRHYKVNKDGEWTKLTNEQLEKQEEVTRGLGISPSEYWSNKDEYDFAYEKPDKYALAKSVGGYDSYKGYTSELYDIKADKDKNGKSINGSRKAKVLDYINNLDADYYTKIILFKSEYNADDTHNREIINYLNGRDDISYDEMVSILKELGFTVSANGNISW